MRDETKASSNQSSDGSPATRVFCPRASLLDVWSSHDWTQGVQIDRLETLDRVFVQTANSLYELTVLVPSTGEVSVRGGKYFSEAVTARVAGSSLGGSFLKHRGIYVGYQVELIHGNDTVVTGLAQKIDVLRVFLTPK
jgi:hypothetical protein